LFSYQIVIIQASPSIVNESAVLRALTGLNIQILPNVAYEDILQIIGASRLMLSLTINDGLPSILVEAMSLGAFPIHSNLDSISELIVNDENGILVPPEDHFALASALRKALLDDRMVDQAEISNKQIVQERLSSDIVRSKVIELYNSVGRQGCLGSRIA